MEMPKRLGRGRRLRHRVVHDAADRFEDPEEEKQGDPGAASETSDEEMENFAEGGAESDSEYELPMSEVSRVGQDAEQALARVTKEFTLTYA